MPGVDEKSTDITLEKNVLTIYGRVEADVPENHRLCCSEYGVGDYQRVFTLSDEVDGEKIQAVVKNGVLRLVMPKAEAAKTRKIPVKAEGID
jgi:HSP20 family molecular chaperone IbpA